MDHFARVQEGIDAVKAGGTVTVDPGNYNENGSLSKNATLLLQSGATTIGSLTMSTGGVVASGCNLFVGSTFSESGGSFTSSPTAGTFTVGRSFSLSGGVFNRFTGSSTSGNPFLIYDVYGLQAMELGLNSNYQLANDVDASTTANWNGGAGFAPVGNMGTGNAFAGSFYCAYHKITGLYINRPTQNYVGPFGSATTGTFISCVGLVGESIVGSGYAGGLVGYLAGGTISYSHAAGNVSGASNGAYFGGLAGCMFSSSLSDSYAASNVSAG